MKEAHADKEMVGLDKIQIPPWWYTLGRLQRPEAGLGKFPRFLPDKKKKNKKKKEPAFLKE